MEVEKVTLFKCEGTYFFTEEEAAKHKICSKCGVNHRDKGRIYCKDCRDADSKAREDARKAKLLNYPTTIWHGDIDCVYDETSDRWFYDEEEVTEYYEEDDRSVEEAILIVGEPIYLKLDLEDYIMDRIGDHNEDMEFSDLTPEFLALIDKVDEYLEENKIIIAYTQGKERVLI